VFVSRSVDVVDGQVALDFSLIDFKEEVLLGDDFLVGVGSKDLNVDLLLEFNKLKLLLNNAVNSVFDFLDGLGVISMDHLRFEVRTVLVLVLKAGQVSGILRSLHGLEFSLLGRVVPQSLNLFVSDVGNIRVVSDLSGNLGRESTLECRSIYHTTGN